MARPEKASKPSSYAEAERRRINVLSTALILAASIIAGRLIYYQVILHADLKEQTEELRRAEIILPAQRGAILDATEHPLALTVAQWDISVSPAYVTEATKVSAELARLLEMPQDELYAKLTADAKWVQIAKYVPAEIGEAIAALDADGLECKETAKRVYPEGPLTAHVIGIVDENGIGYYGVEGYYNQRLRGVEGKRETEKSGLGDELPLAPHAEQPPQAGADLILTLDRNIQLIADQELQRALEQYDAESGTVVIMDPRTGALLAVVSYPRFDPTDRSEASMSQAGDPSLSMQWEPGSIFKVVTWAAGLDLGTITPDTSYYDSGGIEVGGRYLQNWDRTTRGDVTMTEGLAYSLNTVAAHISTTMGKDSFYSYVRRFGIGTLTGVDLEGEIAGMLKMPGDANWFPSELGTNAFGQGIALTPVQMIAAVAAVANDGLLMKPYIVSKFVTQDKTVEVEPMAVRQAISRETAHTLTEMMVQVVATEAVPAQVAGYRVAGKTGTAEIPTAYGYDATDTIASFIGYAPADDPRFVILVKLDKPQVSEWANDTAAPTFQAIAQRLLVYMQIPPDAYTAVSSLSERLAPSGQDGQER